MDKHWQKPENQRQRNFWREDQLDFYFIPAFIQVSPFLDTLRTNRLNSYAVTLHVLLFAVIWMYSNFSGVPEKSTVCHLFGDGIFIACIRDFLCNILNTSGTFCVIHQSRANWLQVQSSDLHPDVQLLKNSRTSAFSFSLAHQRENPKPWHLTLAPSLQFLTCCIIPGKQRKSQSLAYLLYKSYMLLKWCHLSYF